MSPQPPTLINSEQKRSQAGVGGTGARSTEMPLGDHAGHEESLKPKTCSER